MVDKFDSKDISYDENLIEEIRLSNDLINLVGEYTNLKQAGKSYKALCPFHEEKTPSFNVDPDKQLYYCFGCSAGGNAYNFVMETEGMTFPEAIKYLADRAGIILPEKKTNKKYKKRKNKKEKLYEIHELVVKFYNYLLTEKEIGKEAYQYLQERNFTDEIIAKFKLGFAPNRWQAVYNFLSKKGYSDQIIEEAGLILPRKSSGYYDRFRGRVIFSIYDFRGQAIAFGGRIIEDIDQPKYLNSPETIIYNKSRNLYGLNWAKQSIQQSNQAIIVEGYTDVIRAHQFGIENVIASLGTSLTREQAKLLNRYAEQIYIAYDSDAAGAEATIRGLDILKQAGLQVKVIQLPQGEDPDDFISQQGKDKFLDLQSKAVSLVDFKLNNIIKGRNLKEIDNKIKVVNNIIDVLAAINNKIELDEYIKQVSEEIKVSPQILRSELKDYSSNKKRRNKSNTAKTNNKLSRNNKARLRERLNENKSNYYQKTVEKLIGVMLADSQAIYQVKEELDKDCFRQEAYQELITSLFNADLADNSIDINQLLQELKSRQAKDILLKESVRAENKNYNQAIINDYINRIKEYQIKMKLEELDRQIKEAEKSGETDKAIKLLQQYQQLTRGEGM